MTAPALRQVVYCSGPLFSPAERWEQARIADVLEAGGWATYLPQRDGVPLGDISARLARPDVVPEGRAWCLRVLRRVTFALDLYQLLGCSSALVCNLNGRVPDEGSVVEVAVAATAGVPVVLYKQTHVTMLAEGDNPMLAGLDRDWEVAGTVGDIPTMLARRMEDAATGGYRYTVAPGLADAVRAGEAVAGALGTLRPLARTGADVVAALGRWVSALATPYLTEDAGPAPRLVAPAGARPGGSRAAGPDRR